MSTNFSFAKGGNLCPPKLKRRIYEKVYQCKELLLNSLRVQYSTVNM